MVNLHGEVFFLKHIKQQHVFIFFLKCQQDIIKKQRKASKKKKRFVKGIKIIDQKIKKCQYSYERFKNLSEEEKNKKPQYSCGKFRSIPEDEKQKLVEHRKNNSKMQKFQTM